MIGSINREFAVQILVALVVVVGAWMMFVDPKASELREIEQRIEASMKPQDQPGLGADQFATQAASLRKRINEVSQQNDAAINSSELYSHIGQLAHQHGVIVQNMRPGSRAEGNEKSKVQMIRIDLSIEGSYENCAEFLEAVAAVSGFVRPVTMTVAPLDKGNEQIVVVRYVCELLQFELPEALMAFKETSSGV